MEQNRALVTRETYCWTKNRQVLTAEQLHVPGLRVFGHSLNHHAASPLETHIHSGCMELVLLMKGNQTYTVAEGSYAVSGGQTFISFVGEEHSSGGEPQNISEIYWIQLDFFCDEPFLGLASPWGTALRDRLGRVSQRVINCGKELRSCMVNGFRNISSSDPCRKEYGRSQIVSFLYGLIVQEKAGVITLSEEIAEAVAYIGQHVREDIRLEELAGCAGLSLSRFKTRFKQEIGTTPREYVNQLKIREAKKMLQGELPVTQIALDLGFGSSNYFAVLFRQITLYTPSQYRKMMRGQ